MFEKETRDPFLERPVNFNFRARKAVYVCRVCIQDQSFNNFENDTMKLSVNKAKFTGLCARNCATIQQVLILKFAFGSENLTGLSSNSPATGPLLILLLSVICRSYVLGIPAAFSFCFSRSRILLLLDVCLFWFQFFVDKRMSRALPENTILHS